jgi:hypothetical protein
MLSRVNLIWFRKKSYFEDLSKHVSPLRDKCLAHLSDWKMGFIEFKWLYVKSGFELNAKLSL